MSWLANAGVGEFAPLASLTEEHFDKLFDLNVKGTSSTVQKALTLMNDGGSIILLGSVASVKGTPAFGAYGATKAAVLQSGASLDCGAEGPPHSLQRPKPGSDQDARWWIDKPPKAIARLLATIPMGRMGEPDEVRQGSGVPGLRRFQLCHGHRTIRRWRPRYPELFVSEADQFLTSALQDDDTNLQSSERPGSPPSFRPKGI